MMILAQLAYYDVPGMSYKSTGITVTLDEMLENTEDKLIKDRGIDPQLIESLKVKIGNGKYVITKAENDKDDTGFAALAITGPDLDTVTVAVRGTEGFTMDYDSRKDVYTDSQLVHKIEANQQKKMNEFMLGMEEFDNIYMTAHSLGGNLIVSGAVGFLFPEKIKGVNTYNAPGQNAAYLIIHSEGIQKLRTK